MILVMFWLIIICIKVIFTHYYYEYIVLMVLPLHYVLNYIFIKTNNSKFSFLYKLITAVMHFIFLESHYSYKR